MNTVKRTDRAGRRHVRKVTWISVLLAIVASVLVVGAPPASAAAGALTHVGTSSTAGNRTSHTVTIPAGVQAGDTLVAFLTTNTTATTVNDPAGWTVLESGDGNRVRGRAYTRQAVAGDAGDPFTITTSAPRGTTKSVMSVSAYRSSLGTSSVTDSAISIVNTSGTSSTTPDVAVSDENSWVVSYWSEKSSTDGIVFTLPAGVTQRGAATSTGSGKTSGVVADSNGPVAIGTAAGKVATVNSAISRSVTYSVAVSPGAVADPPTNQAPDAVFTIDCVGLACTTNGVGSSDPDGDALTYTWNWGDGTPDTAGVNGSHTYATAGNRTVTLTVSDGELQDDTTRDAVTTAPPSNQAPNAAFTIDCVDLACTTNGVGSSDPNGDALTYTWNWGDGTPDTAGVNGSHTYATAGNRTVTLTVSDSELQDTATQSAVTTAPNQAPVAVFTIDCVGRACTTNASGSSDPNNDPLTYTWNWGDGTPDTAGVNGSHTYATAGNRTVTLTVSDSKLQHSTTQSAVTTATPGVGVLSLVGVDNTAGNRSNHRTTIPAAVLPGDTLLLFLTTNSLSTIANPAGWTLIQTRDGNDFRGRAWTRTAGPGDAGAGVLVTTSAAAKSAMSLSAYRSTEAASSVTASASAIGNSSDATLTAPAVAVAQENSWLVNYWSEKTSTDSTVWTLPADVTSRGSAASTGSGKVSGILGDSNGPVPTGNAAARTANISPAAGRNVTFSVVIGPGVDTGNRVPTAAFTMNCVSLTCEVDAAGSFDLDRDPLTYTWNWGDGTPAGSGANASHKYATTGTRTVTLTVSDGVLSATATRQGTTTAPNPGPGHTRMVPETPRTNTPMISDGEIWDIEVVGNRAFYVGSFSSVRNNANGNTTNYPNRRQIVAFNLTTGLVDATFNPTITGTLDAVEASPDGTKLFIAGNFTAINGIAKQHVASVSLTTGAPVAGFTVTPAGRVTELAVTNSTVYLGGRFTHVNGSVRGALAAVNSTSGALLTNFVNNISGGVGVSGVLQVQRLILSHDMRTLVVVHTGRQVNGQDRYGVALVSGVTNQLLPWSTRLWQDNLQFVGGIQRAFTADIAPDDSYFVVGSGSGGDRPPINDTVIRFPIEGGANVEATWISRHFDSIYSVAATEQGVYAGGHFMWNESPTARDPWPGLDDVGYGTGQGLGGYGLGDEVVRREHLGLLDPATGKAREWYSTSNSAEGEKAMLAFSGGLLIGGDGPTKGGFNVGRIAFFDFASIPAANGTDTVIVDPIVGRVKQPNQEFTVSGTATANSGVNRVELTVFDRQTQRYLADNLTTWQTANNTILTTLGTPGANSTTWSLPLTITNNREMELRARTFSNTGSQDPSPAIKKFETFDYSDQPPDANVNGPGGIVASTAFTITGSATDDVGVQSISFTLQDESNDRYLQDDGSVATNSNSFNVEPDVVGATSTTWSYDMVVPYEGEWSIRVRAVDTAGQLPRHRRPHVAGGQQRHRPHGDDQRAGGHDAADLGADRHGHARPADHVLGARLRRRGARPGRDPAAQQHHR